MGIVENKGSVDEPFISVVTPFYNTERYLVDCIESVLKQTYQNYEYILVDNCSTDESLDIAKKYAKRDNRIIIKKNDKFISQIQNYNHALKQISSKSKYTKIVQADDWLFPNCLKDMVSIAQKDSETGIVSSYGLQGKYVSCEGLNYPCFSMNGKDACRIYLMEGKNIFGNPTTMLFKSELIRNREPFYNEHSVVEDIGICFEILKDHKFGFVHKILVYCRTQDDSITAGIDDFNPYLLHRYMLTKKYGKDYLDDKEFKIYLENIESQYFIYLAKMKAIPKGNGFWKYHHKGLEETGIDIKRKLRQYSIKLIIESILNPLNSAMKIYNNLWPTNKLD